MEFVVNNFNRVIIMANKEIVTGGSPHEIFWDFDAMKVSMLKQPYVSRLCKELGLQEGIVTMKEAVEAILQALNGGAGVQQAVHNET
jgi:energy-coupling factor transport system ATP-binding protein